MNPEMFNILGISIRWYSVMILIGIFLAYLVMYWESKKHKLPNEFLFNLFFWVVICGIIGARLYYVIFNFSYYKKDLLEIFRVWNGGLAIHGGLIGGFIALIIYCKINKVNALEMMDMAVPGIILAQAIGRWGNFFNSEAHGGITSYEVLKSFKIIPEFVIKGMKINGVYYQPTFYYESLWCIVGFIVLITIRKVIKNLNNGQLTCVYLMWYSMGRFFIESLRTDSLMFFNLKQAQLISIVLFVIGLVGFIYLLVKNIKNKSI